jgi:hypothetical protein
MKYNIYVGYYKNGKMSEIMHLYHSCVFKHFGDNYYVFSEEYLKSIGVTNWCKYCSKEKIDD